MQLTIQRWKGLTSFDKLPDQRLVDACEAMLAGLLDKPVDYVDGNGDVQSKTIDFTLIPYNPNTELVDGIESDIDPEFDPSEDEILSKMEKFGDEIDIKGIEILPAGTTFEYEDKYGNDEEMSLPFDLEVDWNITLYVHIHGDSESETCYYNTVDVKLVRSVDV